MGISGMKGKLEERIKSLEKEKSMLLEEIGQLKEIVELSEKAKDLESEVNKLKKDVKNLRDRIPQEFLPELCGEAPPSSKEEEEKPPDEECSSREEEDFL